MQIPKGRGRYSENVTILPTQGMVKDSNINIRQIFKLKVLMGHCRAFISSVEKQDILESPREAKYLRAKIQKHTSNKKPR